MNPRKILTLLLFSGGAVYLAHAWKGWPLEDQRMIYVALIGAFVGAITSK